MTIRCLLVRSIQPNHLGVLASIFAIFCAAQNAKGIRMTPKNKMASQSPSVKYLGLFLQPQGRYIVTHWSTKPMHYSKICVGDWLFILIKMRTTRFLSLFRKNKNSWRRSTDRNVLYPMEVTAVFKTQNSLVVHFLRAMNPYHIYQNVMERLKLQYKYFQDSC